MPSLRCRHYDAVIAMPSLRCRHCDAVIAMPSLRCRHCDAVITMPSLRCRHCDAVIAMPSLRCRHCDAVIAMPSLRCRHCDAVIAMPSLRCSHCDEVTAVARASMERDEGGAYLLVRGCVAAVMARATGRLRAAVTARESERWGGRMSMLWMCVEEFYIPCEAPESGRWGLQCADAAADS
jgi:phage FluMu protein Com